MQQRARPDETADGTTRARVLRAVESARGPTEVARLCRATTTLLGTSGAALVALGSDGPGVVVAATDVDAEQFEQHQFEMGEGPTSDAHTNRRATVVPWFEDDERWPVVASLAGTFGIAGVAAVPVLDADACTGVLSTWSATRLDLTDEQLATADALAGLAAQFVQPSRSAPSPATGEAPEA